MTILSLIDARSGHKITLDRDALTLRLEIDNQEVRQARLKAYHMDVLHSLFALHPQPLSYQAMTDVLRRHHLVINDVTRMHRKVSEIRTHLETIHPALGDIILNTRGVGYSLLLCFHPLYEQENGAHFPFKNPHISRAFDTLHALVQEAIALSAGNKIVRHPQGFVIDRDSCRDVLVRSVQVFNQACEVILKEARVHEADFTGIRIQYHLAKLRTYIGLARVCDYAISHEQWMEWFKQEVWALFEDLQTLLKRADIE